MTIQPVGKKILVLPKPKEEHHKTESGLTVVDVTLSEGVVVAVGREIKDVYKEGDVIIFSKNAGVGQFYQGKAHLWLDGEGAPQGSIWGIISNGTLRPDKGDSL